MSAGHQWSSAAIVLLGWGVLALGGSQPWGYVPLLAGMALFGAAACLTHERACPVSRGLFLSLLGLCAAVLLQLIPLPADVLGIISPAATTLSGPAGSSTRPLSIDPGATSLGLAFLVALSLFFAGTVKTIGHRGARRLTLGLVGLGALVAIVGIAEASTSWSGLYRAAGMPLPPDSQPHGPFSSRNHYAGWMLMTLALTMGYLCAGLESQRTITRSFLIVQCAALAMAIAVVQTGSRAGILGLAVAILTMSALLVRRVAASRARLLVAGPLIALLLFGIMGAGVQAVVGRFDVDSWSTAHGRLPIWRQATSVARDFPVTGSGLNTYQRIVRFYPTPDLDEPYEGAHNDFLQLAVEGGLLLGLPFLVTVSFLIRETWRRFHESSDDSVTRWLRTGAVVGLLLIAAQETVEFSLQIPGNAALFVVLAAIAVHRRTPDTSRASAAHPTSGY